MSKTVYRKSNRIITGVIVIMMLFIVLLSAYFIASHVHHNCSGEDCPICVCIQQCEMLIRGLGSGVPDSAAVFTLLFVAAAVTSKTAGAILFNNPVSDKVRLNN